MRKTYLFAARGGFTLIELLVVIAIISLLSSVVVASIRSARTKGRDTQRLVDIQELRKALEIYYNNSGAYLRSTPPPGPPGWAESCLANWTATCTGADHCLSKLVAGNYLRALALDPTNVSPICYRYRGDSDNFKFAVYLEITGNQTRYAANDGGVRSDWYELFTPGAQGWNW